MFFFIVRSPDREGSARGRLLRRCLPSAWAGPNISTLLRLYLTTTYAVHARSLPRGQFPFRHVSLFLYRNIDPKPERRGTPPPGESSPAGQKAHPGRTTGPRLHVPPP